MTRAAHNVAQTSAETTKKFGHLHIVFRDWQSVDSNTESVYQHIFGMEQTAESAVRNQIRKDVLQSFESVSVWLFDAPSESTAALKTRLTIDKTSAAFRQQVRGLRASLSNQLRAPTLFAGRPLTGHSISPLVSLVAEALNRGETVLPQAAYVSMMRQEVDLNRQQLDAVLRERMESELAAVAAEVSKETFVAESAAVHRFEAAVHALVRSFEEDCQGRVGDLTEDMRQNVMSDTTTAVARMCDHVTGELDTIFHGIMHEKLTIFLGIIHESLSV